MLYILRFSLIYLLSKFVSPTTVGRTAHAVPSN